MCALAQKWILTASYAVRARSWCKQEAGLYILQPVLCEDSRTWIVAGHINTNKNDDDDDNNNVRVVFHYVNRIVYRWPEHRSCHGMLLSTQVFLTMRYDTIILRCWWLLMRHSIIYHLFRMYESRVNDNSLFFKDLKTRDLISFGILRGVE